MLSRVALNRIAERKRPINEQFAYHLRGRPLRCDAIPLSVEDLLGKLRTFGLVLDRSSLESLIGEALSAEEVAMPIIERRNYRTQEAEAQADWIWVCIGALWERWFPDKPNFERLDDKIQAGYDFRSTGDIAGACEIWLDAWSDVLRIMDKSWIWTIAVFDERFRGTNTLNTWIQELVTDLRAASKVDRKFLIARIAVCEEGLKRFTTDDPLSIENRRRALAGSYFEIGEIAKAEGLYREWLETDPAWGWGWIGWSEFYRFTTTEFKDLERSEQLLREGLAIAEVNNRDDILARLGELCEEQGRNSEARKYWREAKRIDDEAKRLMQQEFSNKSVGEGQPVSKFSNFTPAVRGPKAGRNEPCPCGSGKKFKKCCGG